jgi:hypothetical protein
MARGKSSHRLSGTGLWPARQLGKQLGIPRSLAEAKCMGAEFTALVVDRRAGTSSGAGTDSSNT